jgi:excisionase family DNA binding protein
MSVEEGWVDVEEVAAHLRVAKESVYRWVESKGFPAHRVGRLLRFKLSEVDKWVRSCGATDRPTSTVPPRQDFGRVRGKKMNRRG